MKIDEIIRQSDIDGDRDIVGLCIYYADQLEGQDWVDSSQIHNLLNEARIETLSKSSIWAHMRYLKEDDLISDYQSGYRLTLDGISYYDELTPDLDIETTKSYENAELFINLSSTPNEFYTNLVDDINQCYTNEIYQGCLVLSRKLLENLLIDLLRARFGFAEENIDLFYDTNNGRFQTFHTLLSNFEQNLDDFQYFSDRVDQELVENIRNAKNRGDASAHSLEVNISNEEIEQYRDMIDEAVGILFYTRSEIRAVDRRTSHN